MAMTGSKGYGLPPASGSGIVAGDGSTAAICDRQAFAALIASETRNPNVVSRSTISATNATPSVATSATIVAMLVIPYSRAFHHVSDLLNAAASAPRHSAL